MDAFDVTVETTLDGEEWTFSSRRAPGPLQIGAVVLFFMLIAMVGGVLLLKRPFIALMSIPFAFLLLMVAHEELLRLLSFLLLGPMEQRHVLLRDHEIVLWSGKGPRRRVPCAEILYVVAGPPPQLLLRRGELVAISGEGDRELHPWLYERLGQFIRTGRTSGSPDDIPVELRHLHRQATRTG